MAGEAGEEKGRVRREDEEPGCGHPQGGRRKAGVGGGEARQGNPQVRGDGGQAPIHGDHAQQQVPRLFLVVAEILLFLLTIPLLVFLLTIFGIVAVFFQLVPSILTISS
jgi:hypothetical protein